MAKIFISLDTTSESLGSAKIVEWFNYHHPEVEIVRTGSRGMFWLEPMVEVETENGRVGYGPINLAEMPQLIEQGLLLASDTPECFLGDVEQIPFFANQNRFTFSRVGKVDPKSVESYIEYGGFEGLKRAIAVSSQAIIDEVKSSGLRGRGGAAFPTGIKWQTVADCEGEQKYIVCNADEGDSGTFADRMLMEGDPLSLIEGMTIAGIAVGASKGYIYLREEYPQAYKVLNAAIIDAKSNSWLGDNIQGSNHSFDIEVRLGAQAYICGEETSLLNSLEGKRGEVRSKPPLPAIKGFLQRPTVVNNVISLASVPAIMAKGGDYYANYGMGRSMGTMAFQLAGNLKQTGLVELAFGVTLDELLHTYGGGSYTGKPLRAVQVGGPLGAYLPQEQWATPMDYESFQTIGAMVGHGGIVAFDTSVDMSEQARFSMEFCKIESCGKCTPCRIGSTRGVETIDKIRSGDNVQENRALLDDLCDTMFYGSLCAMGGMTPYPVKSAITHFEEDFDRPEVIS